MACQRNVTGQEQKRNIAVPGPSSPNHRSANAVILTAPPICPMGSRRCANPTYESLRWSQLGHGSGQLHASPDGVCGWGGTISMTVVVVVSPRMLPNRGPGRQRGASAWHRWSSRFLCWRGITHRADALSIPGSVRLRGERHPPQACGGSWRRIGRWAGPGGRTA